MMKFNPNNPIKILRKISFPRLAGTRGEEKARKILIDFIEKYGYHAREEKFNLKVFYMKKSFLEIVSPWHEEIGCSGVGFSGNTSEEGIYGEINYIESGDPMLISGKKKYFLCR